MTLAARLSVPTLANSPNCGVSLGLLGSWAGAGCPNCRRELRVALTPCAKHAPHPRPPPQHLPVCRAHQCSHSAVISGAPGGCVPLISDRLDWSCSTPCLEERLELQRRLRLSGWYYGSLDWQGARNILKDASVGAFLIRDSGDTKFMFSLSVQTVRGPTSVRLHIEHGYFRLDCDRPIAKYMARFRCVVELVQHYTRLGLRAAANTVWVDREGCPHSPVLLQTPLRKHPPSLMHAARLAIHKALDSNPVTPKLSSAPKHRLLPLPSSLIDYLGEYPYSI